MKTVIRVNPETGSRLYVQGQTTLCGIKVHERWIDPRDKVHPHCKMCRNNLTALGRAKMEERKCKNCGGPIIAVGSMYRCEYCESAYIPETSTSTSSSTTTTSTTWSMTATSWSTTYTSWSTMSTRMPPRRYENLWKKRFSLKQRREFEDAIGAFIAFLVILFASFGFTMFLGLIFSKVMP
jgi:hypothetical protein